jgi:hypothetical protein
LRWQFIQPRTRSALSNSDFDLNSGFDDVDTSNNWDPWEDCEDYDDVEDMERPGDQAQWFQDLTGKRAPAYFDKHSIPSSHDLDAERRLQNWDKFITLNTQETVLKKPELCECKVTRKLPAISFTGSSI